MTRERGLSRSGLFPVPSSADPGPLPGLPAARMAGGKPARPRRSAQSAKRVCALPQDATNRTTFIWSGSGRACDVANLLARILSGTRLASAAGAPVAQQFSAGSHSHGCHYRIDLVMMGAFRRRYDGRENTASAQSRRQTSGRKRRTRSGASHATVAGARPRSRACIRRSPGVSKAIVRAAA